MCTMTKLIIKLHLSRMHKIFIRWICAICTVRIVAVWQSLRYRGTPTCNPHCAGLMESHGLGVECEAWPGKNTPSIRRKLMPYFIHQYCLGTEQLKITPLIDTNRSEQNIYWFWRLDRSLRDVQCKGEPSARKFTGRQMLHVDSKYLFYWVPLLV